MLKHHTDEIQEEIQDLKTELQEHKKKVDSLEKKMEAVMTDNNSLKNDVVHLSRALEDQQRYLESLEFEKRKNNLIITGITEEHSTPDQEPKKTDMEKITEILTNIGLPEVELESWKE